MTLDEVYKTQKSPMDLHELLAHPAVLLLLVAFMAFFVCFFIVWVHCALMVFRVLRILLHLEKLGYQRSPLGWWSWRMVREFLASADRMDSLGSPKMDVVREKLRKQVDSHFAVWMLVLLSALLTVIVVLFAFLSGKPVVLWALLPFCIVFYVLYRAMKFQDSWRCR